MRDNSRHVTVYELFTLLLSVFALCLLAANAVLPLDAEARRIIDAADLVVCVFFLLDFVVNLRRAPDKLRYFYTWGWLDLLASIPAIDVFRIARIGRIVRILRVLRLIKASRRVAVALSKHRRESALWAAAFVSIVAVFVGSVAILQLENDGGGNISNAEDALWWSLTTIMNVGYGERYPVTSEGRLVALALMIVGVGLFGTLSGAAASWFVEAPSVGKEA